jgi:GNAT superfamily N-acetyltransferase
LEGVLARLSRRYSVARVTPERSGPLLEFLQRASADQPIPVFHESQRLAAHWKWVTELYPPVAGEKPTGWICLKDDRIIGHFGMTPAVARLRSQDVPVCWGRDLLVSPEARGAGAGPLLIETAVRESNRPFLVAGLNPASTRLFQRMGFRDLGGIPLYLSVRRPREFASLLPGPRKLGAAAAGVLHFLGDLRARAARGSERKIQFECLDRFDERWDRWWEQAREWFPAGIHRPSAAMQWRYFQHPRHRYSAWVAVEDGAWQGVAVGRHGRSRGLPAGFITEVLTDPRDPPLINALIRHAEETLGASAAEPLALIRCAVRQPALEQGLSRSGYWKVPTPLRWMVSGPDLRQAEWMINGGDSDLDAV